MKYAVLLLLGLGLVAGCPTFADTTEEVAVEAPIAEVTVYPGLAKITRIAELDLGAGEHSILIERLPIGIDAETFSVAAAGAEDALILGFRHREVHHLESPRKQVAEVDREIKKLEQGERQILRDHLEAFRQQKRLLDALASTAGKEMGDQVIEGALDVSQWEAAYDFLGRKYIQTDDSVRLTTIALNEVNLLHGDLVHQKRQLEADRKRTSITVTVDLRLETAGRIDLALDYVIPGASWKPIYDARLNPLTDTVELGYFAEVTQTTGEDWEDVELTLSTSLPARGTGPGDLLGWYLTAPSSSTQQYSELGGVIGVKGRSKIIDKFVTGAQVEMSKEEITGRPVQTVDALLEQVAGAQTNDEGEVFIRGSRAGEVAYVVDGLPVDAPLSLKQAWSFNTAFRIRRKETVLSDGQAVRTPIAVYDLEASPRFICRPKNREDAYRVMSVKNQDEAPLMPGWISIFVGSNYVGRAVLADMILPREEFNMPFGPDNSIKVTRKIIDYKEEYQSSKIKTDQTVEINLVNHGLEPRKVLLEEPIPVSRDSRIEVDVRDVSPDTEDPDELGNLRWNLTLLPGKEQVVQVSYRVEHPRGLPVQGL